MTGQRLAYWIFLGTIGLAAFFMLRPSVDFNANDPIGQSSASIEGRTAELADQLGFSVDSLHVLALRSQHISYYDSLEDSLEDAMPPPSELMKPACF